MVTTPSSGNRGPRGAPRDAKSRLKKVRILIGDPDERVSSLVYNVLRSFGFDQVDVVRDGQSMLQVLRDKDVDLLVSEWDLQNIDGIRLIELIRTQGQHRWQRDLPAIILTGKADLESVRKARDAGFTEFVAKPFSAKSLSTRLLQMIDNPRQFVVSPAFNGPDRRRRDIPNFDPALERRGKQAAAALPEKSDAVIDAENVERAQMHAIAEMNEDERIAYTQATGTMTKEQRLVYIRSDESGSAAEKAARAKVKGTLITIERERKEKSTQRLVEILPPNKRLIQLIGDDVKGSDIFTEKLITGAQEEIKKKESEFLEWADNDIRMLEASYKKLTGAHNDPEAKDKLLAAAYSLKSQAGIFGYDMGTEVSRMLLDYMPPEKPINDQTLIVLRKFLDTISVVFRLKVKEAGGEIGAALIKGLQILTKKLG